MADSSRVRLLFQQADQCIYAQNFEVAVEKLTHVLRLEPTNTKAMDSLGEVFLELDLVDQAKEVRL